MCMQKFCLTLLVPISKYWSNARLRRQVATSAGKFAGMPGLVSQQHRERVAKGANEPNEGSSGVDRS